jgi:hypothetical protein
MCLKADCFGIRLARITLIGGAHFTSLSAAAAAAAAAAAVAAAAARPSVGINSHTMHMEAFSHPNTGSCPSDRTAGHTEFEHISRPELSHN